jgi:hypothetical protein
MSNGDLFELDLITAPCIEMSTSIVSIYTQEGFVIAADGRNYSLETQSIVSDSVQKIFPIEKPDLCLAYSVSGTAELTPKGSDEVIFDVLARIHEAVEETAKRRSKSLWHFAQALSHAIADFPDKAKQAVIGDEPPTIIFLEGYFEGRPKRTHITIFYDGQVPEVSTDPLTHGRACGVGSNEIIDALKHDHGALAKYRTPSLNVKDSDKTLTDAVDAARSWMSAHCSPGIPYGPV